MKHIKRFNESVSVPFPSDQLSEYIRSKAHELLSDKVLSDTSDEDMDDYSNYLTSAVEESIIEFIKSNNRDVSLSKTFQYLDTQSVPLEVSYRKHPRNINHGRDDID